DGIRDFHVTGVQTCALPICYLLKDEGVDNVVRAIRTIHDGATWFSQAVTEKFVRWQYGEQQTQLQDLTDRERQVLELISQGLDRSEERRVGKECRCRWRQAE